MRFGHQTAGAMIGFVQREGFVVGREIKVAGPKCRRKRDAAIIRNFVEGAVVAHASGFEVDSCREHAGQGYGSERVRKTSLCRKRPFPHSRKKSNGRE